MMFIIFWDFLMVQQIFLSPQVKRSVIITNKLICVSCLTSWWTAEDVGSQEIMKYQGNLKKIIELLSSA